MNRQQSRRPAVALDEDTTRRDGGRSMKERLGERLRTARVSQGKSLRGVAAAVGVSGSMLSQVETGRISPSVTTLYDLVTYLDVSLDELLGLTPSDTAAAGGLLRRSVQRASENAVIEMDNGVTWERLATAGRSDVDPLLITYAPGASSSIDGTPMRHSGIEYGLLTDGELTLQLGEESCVLRRGDSICFESRHPHLYRNDSGAPARGVWFVTEQAAQEHLGNRPDEGTHPVPAPDHPEIP